MEAAPVATFRVHEYLRPKVWGFLLPSFVLSCILGSSLLPYKGFRVFIRNCPRMMFSATCSPRLFKCFGHLTAQGLGIRVLVFFSLVVEHCCL